MRKLLMSCLLAVVLALVGCTESGAADDDTGTNNSGKADKIVGEITSDETPFADTAIADVTVSHDPVTFIKGPWFQWPTPEGFFVMAETSEDIPLDVLVEWEGGAKTFYSEPWQPEFDLLGIPMDGLDGHFHQVEIVLPEGVAAVTVSVLNGEGFVAKLPMPHAQKPLRMVMFGDTRTHPEDHQMVIDKMVGEKPALVVHSGDLVYAGGMLKYWEEFFEIERELLASTFFLPVFGNHELGGESYFETFFEMRNNFDDTERNWFLEVGDVGIIGIQDYKTDWTDDESLLWLEQTLQKLEDKKWLFFTHHEPMYSFSNHGPWLEGREYVQPLLEEYGVDLVLAGHNHCYERFEVNGITYVVSGGGGAPLYSTGDGPDDEMDLAQNWGKFHHYLTLDITDDKIHAVVFDVDENSIFEEFDL